MVEKSKKETTKLITEASSALQTIIQIINEEKTEQNLELLLGDINKAVEVYNIFHQGEKIEITKKSSEKKEEVDVSNIFVCVYNDEQVGLFKKINYCSKCKDEDCYDAGSIYVGIDSDYIGIKETHWGYHFTPTWKKAGARVIVDNHSYLCNCNMQNGMSFDDMRLKAHSDGLIDSYKIGTSNPQEMIDVLCYARNYYNLGSTGKAKEKK